MSRLAPSIVFEEAPVKVSPMSGCKSGSIMTSWQTSVRRFAVTSQICVNPRENMAVAII